MKYPILLFLLFLVIGCQNTSPSQPETDTPAEPESVVPVPQPKSPVPYSTDSPSLLHDLLRTTLRNELAYSVVEKSGDTAAKKSHSFEITENNGRPTWVIKVKWHNADTDKVYAGSEYLMLWDVIDKNSIEIVNSPDGKLTAIRIRPTEGDTFLYHPYTQDPDVAVKEAIIGWYDRSQDATLLRAYTYMKQLADNMDKWGK